MSNDGQASHQLHCTLCTRSGSEVDMLVAGPQINGIQYLACDVCIDVMREAVNEGMAKKNKRGTTATIPSPREIDEFLGRYVVGQNAARRAMAVAVHNHYVRLDDQDSDGPQIGKSNILLIGPTGTGKTHIAATLAKMLDVPFTIADATTLTQAGYVGEDVETIVTKLVMAADYNVERAQRGIIYIDEIDKIATMAEGQSVSRDVSGRGVQEALLKLMEGTIASVSPQGGRKNPEQAFLQVDTSKILFICGGAFSGLDRIIAARTEQKSVGFTGNVDAGRDKQAGELFSQVEVDDIVKFGLISEFVGRLPVIATLQDMDEDTLVQILTEPKDAILKQYGKLFAKKNVELRFTDDGIRAISRAALKRRTGARGLRSILEKILQDTMYDLPDLSGTIEAVEVDAEVVSTGKEPIRLPAPANDVVSTREAV